MMIGTCQRYLRKLIGTIPLQIVVLLVCVQRIRYCHGFSLPTATATAIDVILDDAVSSIDFLREAYVPDSLEVAAAVSISEAVAGAVGGLASRGASKVIGNKKKDSLRTKVATTSAFFGTRAVVRVTSRVLGVPRPIQVLSSILIATTVSESAKALGRESDNQLKRQTKDLEEKLDGPEIAGDMSKWILYDVLNTLYHDADSVVDQTLLSVGYGAACSVIGFVVFTILTSIDRRNTDNEITRIQDLIAVVTSRREVPSSYAQIAFEGCVLYGTFELTLVLLPLVFPEQYNMKFAFPEFMRLVESNIQHLHLF